MAEAAVGIHIDQLGSGVVHRAIPTGFDQGVDIIDVDLSRKRARIVISSESLSIKDGVLAGDAFTPKEWLSNSKAIAAVNGGYFGRSVGDSSEEIVGLFIKNGLVRHAAPILIGRGTLGDRSHEYTRTGFGLLANGQPRIDWVATPLRHGRAIRAVSYSYPTGHRLGDGNLWNPLDALSCGPTLIHDGRIVTTDREERLVSPGAMPRTFIAYDTVQQNPRHVVVGIASAEEYSDLAEFIRDYFQRYHGTKVTSAMCLDGGMSTQMSYRQNGTIRSPRDTDTAVPDALMVLPD